MIMLMLMRMLMLMLINHPAKGPAPPGSILFSVPVGVHATKKKKNEEKQEKEQGTSHLAAFQQCANYDLT